MKWKHNECIQGLILTISYNAGSSLWLDHRWLFGLRVARAFREFRGHPPPPPFAAEHVETDVSLIRDWMTIPFIAKCTVSRPLCLGLTGAAIGDMLSFGTGFYAKEWIEQRFGNSATWRGAKETFEERAGLAVFLTRFLITALAVPTNLIAGGSGIKFRRFMLYDSLGEFIWIVLYGGLGY